MDDNSELQPGEMRITAGEKITFNVEGDITEYAGGTISMNAGKDVILNGGDGGIIFGEYEEPEEEAGDTDESEKAQHGGTAYVFGDDGRMIESHPILGSSILRFGIDKVYDDLSALKQFVAIVAGESSDNLNEATGIGQVIINRLNVRGSTLSSGFVQKIGGDGQYDAIGKEIYNAIMRTSFQEIFSPNFASAIRVQGAMRALAGGLDLTGRAYVWNATSQKDSKYDVGFNWKQFNNGTYKIAATIGGTTFFKYADDSKTWP